MVHTSVSADLPSLDALPEIPRPGRVLLTTPDYFRVEYVINPHMEGNVGSVDPAAAQAQWEALRSTYDDLGTEVSTVDGAPDLPDMVFCANQTLPYQTPGGELMATDQGYEISVQESVLLRHRKNRSRGMRMSRGAVGR